jgi:hypothetical protein
MFGWKIRFNLFQAIVAAVISISTGHAANVSSLSKKTYTISFNGVDAKSRFYVDAEGRIFQYARNPCPSGGSFTKLNASNRGQYSCPNFPGFGAVVLSWTAWARLSGAIITYELSFDVQSASGPSLPHSTWQWAFSTDGARCDASPLLVNNQSFPAISCEVSAGRP